MGDPNPYSSSDYPSSSISSHSSSNSSYSPSYISSFSTSSIFSSSTSYFSFSSYSSLYFSASSSTSSYSSASSSFHSIYSPSSAPPSGSSPDAYPLLSLSIIASSAASPITRGMGIMEVGSAYSSVGGNSGATGWSTCSVGKCKRDQDTIWTQAAMGEYPVFWMSGSLIKGGCL